MKVLDFLRGVFFDHGDYDPNSDPVIIRASDAVRESRSERQALNVTLGKTCAVNFYEDALLHDILHVDRKGTPRL